jgi:hypothetical protein
LDLKRNWKLIAGGDIATIGDIWSVEMLPLSVIFFQPSDLALNTGVEIRIHRLGMPGFAGGLRACIVVDCSSQRLAWQSAGGESGDGKHRRAR